MKKLLVTMLVMVMVLGLMGGVVMASSPHWDITGDWDVDFDGGTANRQFLNLIQDEYGNVEGEFWWINNSGDWEYGGTLDGYVSGHSLYLDYDRYPIEYKGVIEGTINQYGMSGTFQATLGSSFSTTWSTAGEPIDLRKDAPAIANELLRDADISNRYGQGRDGGNFIADVAHEMDDDGSFMGVSKFDVCAYRYEIAIFLNQRIAEEGVDGSVEVPELEYVLDITSVNNNYNFWHDITIVYNVNTGEGSGTGVTHGGDMNQTISNVVLDGDELTFLSTYDNGYQWNPTFKLNEDGTLTFVSGNLGGVWDATGYWVLNYLCE